jgi:hypothetical protein
MWSIVSLLGCVLFHHGRRVAALACVGAGAALAVLDAGFGAGLVGAGAVTLAGAILVALLAPLRREGLRPELATRAGGPPARDTDARLRSAAALLAAPPAAVLATWAAARWLPLPDAARFFVGHVALFPAIALAASLALSARSARRAWIGCAVTVAAGLALT